MDNLDNFKQFVKANPTFARFIKDGSMTWQKFYELYDMYGEDSNIWDDFKKIETKKNSPTLTDIVNLAKNIELFSDLFASKSSTTDTYKPRAIYQRFDD